MACKMLLLLTFIIIALNTAFAGEVPENPDTASHGINLLSLLRTPFGYSLETSYFNGDRSFEQAMINYGLSYSAPNYYLDYKILYGGIGFRRNDTGKVILKKRVTGFRFTWPFHIFSKYGKNAVTDYLRDDYTLTAIDHDEAGINQVYARWFNMNNDIVFDKRTYPLDTEIYELPPDKWKFQSKVSLALGWSSWMAGDENYPAKEFPVYDYFRGFETSAGFTASVLYNNNMSVYGSVEIKKLYVELPPVTTTYSLGAYYLLPFNYKKSSAREGVEFSLKYNLYNIDWTGKNHKINSLNFNIKYYGFRYPEVE